MRYLFGLVAFDILVGSCGFHSGVVVVTPRRNNMLLYASGYGDTDEASKGVVSTLTYLVNKVSAGDRSERSVTERNETECPPSSPEELLHRIREDYTKRNYLWTGAIDLSSFDPDCCFTDPTLSFNGTDTFVSNIRNLRPIVDAVTTECRSDLLDISVNTSYIQTRWNMVGVLGRLPWKPRIDVIGRTKFWFQREKSQRAYRVVFYDEEWEIPAWMALLQLVTRAGTMPNSTLDILPYGPTP